MTSKNTIVSRQKSLSAQNCKIWDGSFTRECSSLYSYIWTRVSSLRKQPTFGDVTTGFPAKWRLRNERRNSILMTRHYPDLGSASDWSCCEGNLTQPIRSTTQISVVTRHQYGIYALAPQRHYERKPVRGCFLRLSKIQKTLNSLAPQATHSHY